MKQADLGFKNTFVIEQLRGGEVINTIEVDNGVTDLGKNSVLDVYHGAASHPGTFYIGLIEQNDGSSDTFNAVAVTDTLATHVGWAEYTGYDEANRQTWTPTTANSKAVTGTTASTFTMPGSVPAGSSIAGLLLCTTQTKSNTSGLLWATAVFAGAATFDSGDQFRVTYTVRIA